MDICHVESPKAASPATLANAEWFLDAGDEKPRGDGDFGSDARVLHLRDSRNFTQQPIARTFAVRSS